MDSIDSISNILHKQALEFSNRKLVRYSRSALIKKHENVELTRFRFASFRDSKLTSHIHSNLTDEAFMFGSAIGDLHHMTQTIWYKL